MDAKFKKLHYLSYSDGEKLVGGFSKSFSLESGNMNTAAVNNCTGSKNNQGGNCIAGCGNTFPGCKQT